MDLLTLCHHVYRNNILTRRGLNGQLGFPPDPRRKLSQQAEGDKWNNYDWWITITLTMPEERTKGLHLL